MICVPDLITRAAFRHPDKAAVSCSGKTFTWSQLERRLWQLAKGLLDLGVEKGDRLIYLGHNSHRQYECYYGPARLGAIILPMNVRQSVKEMIDCAKDCTPTLLLVDRHFIDHARAVKMACPSIRHLVYADDGDCPDDMVSYDAFFAGDQEIDRASFEGLASSDGDTIILYYTSGTTGRPKGVMLTHQNIFTNALVAPPIFGLDEHMTHLMSGPMFHLSSGGRAYTNAMSFGHTVILPKFDVVEVMKAVERYQVNVIFMVPTMVSMFLDHPRFSEFNLSSIRLISYGASPMPTALIARALEVLPNTGFAQAYGMTEASPILTILPPEVHDPETGSFDKLLSVGKPVPYVDLRVVDEEDKPVPTGETGEIIARGPMIMAGYWNQPEMTAEAMRDGYYRTGDAGYLDEDGYLYLAGRIKEMIITGGENVYPIETENALMHHPSVDQCAVLGMKDEHWGERIHAVVSLKNGQVVTERELIAFCRDEIAHYKCPRSITIRQSGFPVTATNKIDKQSLRVELEADGSGGPTMATKQSGGAV